MVLFPCGTCCGNIAAAPDLRSYRYTINGFDLGTIDCLTQDQLKALYPGKNVAIRFLNNCAPVKTGISGKEPEFDYTITTGVAPDTDTQRFYTTIVSAAAQSKHLFFSEEQSRQQPDGKLVLKERFLTIDFGWEFHGSRCPDCGTTGISPVKTWFRAEVEFRETQKELIPIGKYVLFRVVRDCVVSQCEKNATIAADWPSSFPTGRQCFPVANRSGLCSSVPSDALAFNGFDFTINEQGFQITGKDGTKMPVDGTSFIPWDVVQMSPGIGAGTSWFPDEPYKAFSHTGTMYKKHRCCWDLSGQPVACNPLP